MPAVRVCRSSSLCYMCICTNLDHNYSSSLVSPSSPSPLSYPQNCLTEWALSPSRYPLQSQFGVRNPLESPLDKGWDVAIARPGHRQEARLKLGAILVEHSHCLWTGDSWLPWGRGWRGWDGERRNDVLWGHRTSTHTLLLSVLPPPALIIQRVVCPPFSLLNSWQSPVTLWNMCKGRGWGGGWGLCYVTVPSLTGAPVLKM